MQYYILPTNKDLQHHGILGQKWGVRRFQNKDGSLTSRGKRRLGIGNDSGVHAEYKATNTNKSGTSKREAFTDYANLREVNKIAKDTNNCSLCTFAMDLRNRGIDVRAGGKNYLNDGKTDREIASWYEGNRQFTDNSKFWNAVDSRGRISPSLNKYQSDQAFKDEIVSQGNGTSGHLTLQNVVDREYADAIGLPYQCLGGHDVFYKVENGELYIYDAQSGKKIPFDEYTSDVYPEHYPVSMWVTGYMRTDDLEPKEDVLTTSDNGQLIGRKKETFRVAEENHSATSNYSPPTKSELVTEVKNYTPPYKSKSEMDLFKEDAEKVIKNVSSSLYKTKLSVKKGLQKAGDVALKVADTMFWLMFR